MRFVQTHATGSDETAPFDVLDIEGMTVGEFVEQVLEGRSSDWGNFTIIKENGYSYPFIGNHHYEYKEGGLKEPIEEVVKQKEVLEVKASGGWSRMDYMIFTK